MNDSKECLTMSEIDLKGSPMECTTLCSMRVSFPLPPLRLALENEGGKPLFVVGVILLSMLQDMEM